MNNNDVIRRLRFTYDMSDEQVMKTFDEGGLKVSRAQVCDWLKKDDDKDFRSLHDKQLAHFLNGFIIQKRGKKEDTIPKAEEALTNNIILRKLKIALDYKVEDILELMESMEFKVSKHEITALFRKPDQKQYRLCKDQFLRVFLQGLQYKLKPKARGKRRRMGEIQKPDFIKKIYADKEKKPKNFKDIISEKPTSPKGFGPKK